MKPHGSALVWFRRDLRDFDHTALAAARQAHAHVHCVFVFDTDILSRLERRNRRVSFLWDCVFELRAALGGSLRVLHGRSVEEIPRLAARLGVAAVYANRDYEPAALARDETVAQALRESGIDFRTRKDQVVFELSEVRTRSGGPFAVFTPYKRAWLARLSDESLASRDSFAGSPLSPAPEAEGDRMPSLEALGFERAELCVPGGMEAGRRLFEDFRGRIGRYASDRDLPAVAGTSRLSAHLRFGTVSIRELARAAHARRSEGAATWLSELIWREFYFAILAARPDVVNRSFKREYDALEWDNDEAAFAAWCEGRCGYPLVDAAMRELRSTGFMHNRLRMVAASFLVKDLGIDWRWGEKHFARELLDHDLAANNGGWQWCASTGCDAQPWFRIFNPVTQSRRFDPDGAYIRRWLPELAQVAPEDIHAPWEMTPLEQKARGCVIGRDYPAPIIPHDEARRRTLARYTRVRKRE